MERDRDALLEYYAGMMPEALGKLTDEERRQVYGMLRLRVKVSSDGSMEATGILRDNLHILNEDDPDIEGNHLCENKLVSRCKFQNTKTPELSFRAFLGDGTTEVRLERLMG